MTMLQNVRKAAGIVRETGLPGMMYLLTVAVPIPLTANLRWSVGTRAEIFFWENYFRTGGAEWAESYRSRLDPHTPLQPRPAALLPDRYQVDILDVGAGPLTHLGKQCPGKTLRITAVDPLADEYQRMYRKYQIDPPVHTTRLAAEDISGNIPPNCYDLVFARNCIDHARNPEAAILQMVDVVKPGGYVLLEHRPNEAVNERYRGLHQWNFSSTSEGEFLIGSRKSLVNMTLKYARLCTIQCETVHESPDGEMLITRIQKK
jgi:SAM-dependent methyltransferase